MKSEEGHIIASCALGEEGDLNNACYLTANALYIMYKGKESSFGLSEIKGVTLKKKVLLFPIVCGGIMTPLSMVALYGLDAAPWITLSLMAAGLLLLYYGIEGSFSLSIETSVKEYDFFVKKISEEMKGFARKVVEYKGK